MAEAQTAVDQTLNTQQGMDGLLVVGAGSGQFRPLVSVNEVNPTEFTNYNLATKLPTQTVTVQGANGKPSNVIVTQIRVGTPRWSNLYAVVDAKNGSVSSATTAQDAATAAVAKAN
jgi:hypothetical protein